MNLQRQLSSGRWMDCGDRTEEFLSYADALHGTREKTLELLKDKKSGSLRISARHRLVRQHSYQTGATSTTAHAQFH